MDTETIYYKSPVGILEIRSANNAIVAVLFLNSWKGKKTDEAALDFATPQLDVIKNCITQLDEYFAGTRKIFSINTIQHGTVFQQTVWQQLCNIPYGKTISYLTLSKHIGNVKAIRAVGTANGNNSVSIIIPAQFY